jgi:hypothetical protein
MPRYEYYCPSNGERFEVRHSLMQRLATWGELCERLGLPVGETPVSAPLERPLSGGVLLIERRGASDPSATGESDGPHRCNNSSCCCG